MEATGDCDPSVEPSGGRGRHCWRSRERKGTDMDRRVKKGSQTVSQRTEESSSVVRLVMQRVTPPSAREFVSGGAFRVRLSGRLAAETETPEGGTVFT